MQTHTQTMGSFNRAPWRETVVLMAASWLAPFLIHLVPWSGPRPLGVYLLPVFWSVFVAVYFFGEWVGLLAALVTPVINLVVTGLPGVERVSLMSLELAGFVGMAVWLVRRWPRLWLTAPLAYVAAKAAAILVQEILPALKSDSNAWTHFLASTRNGLAGLGVLLLINLLLVLIAPRGPEQ